MVSRLRSELSGDATLSTSTTADSVRESAANEAPEAVGIAETSAERVDLKRVSDQSQSPVGEPDTSSDTALDASVDAHSDSDVPAQTAPFASEASERRGVPIWLALVGLVIAALIVGYQMRLNGQLEAEVIGLEAALGRTEAVLDAHMTHLGAIRGGVQDISARLQSLQSLVETEPVVARDQSTPAQP